MSRRRSDKECSAVDTAITLEGLIKRSWHVRHTSMAINRNEEDLKQYGISLTKNVLDAMSKKCKSCKVQLTRCEAIRRDELGPPALLVEVLFDEDTSPTFLGYFLDWASENAMIGDSESLPVYIYRAKNISIAKIINNILIKLFDITISLVQPSTEQFAQFMAVFLKFADEDCLEKKAQLRYSVPLMTSKESITVSTKIKGLQTIFNFLLETVPDNEDVIQIFYDKLLNHYRLAYRLHLNHANLREVIFPHAAINREGQMKVDDLNVLPAALTLLQSIFPDLSSPPQEMAPNSPLQI